MSRHHSSEAARGIKLDCPATPRPTLSRLARGDDSSVIGMPKGRRSLFLNAQAPTERGEDTPLCRKTQSSVV